MKNGEKKKKLEPRIKELKGQRSGNLELDLAALFQGFEDSFPVGITDHKGVILYVNNALVEMWGLSSPEEIIGRQLAEFWEGPGIYRTMEDLATKGWSMGEDIGKRKDGSLFPVDYKAIMCTGLDGKPLYMLGQFVDITAKKNAEQALRESEEKYRNLIEKSDDIIWTTDLDLRTTYASSSIEKKLGFTPEERMEQDSDVQMTSSSYAHVTEILLQELKREQEENADPNRIVRVEVEYYHKNGSILWGENIISGLRDENGILTGFQGISRDITDRKRAEEALRKSEERFREMARLLPNIICEMDINLRLTFVNNIGLETFGFTQDEFDAGINIIDLIHPNDMEKAAKRTEQIMNGMELGSTEYRLTMKDGSELAAIVNAFPIYEDGRIAGIRATITDITELKNIQEELLKARKLESLGTLAGGIAHDFNNLLSVIMGNISLAEDDIRPEIGTFGYLKEATKASLRAQELAARLITFSTGGAPVKEAAFIGGLVKDSVSHILSDSDIDCEISIPEDLSPVEIDEQQMKQVFYNITTNAREAMSTRADGAADRSGKGTIKVYCENITVEEKDTLALKQGKYVRISLKDQGFGIPKENIQKIFDPYFSTKERGTQKGMGLGLAVCHSIVKKHDGLIAVESELEVGTTFIIYLPVSEKEIAELEPAKKAVPARPVTEKGNILVMDDEEMITKLAGQMISRLGYNVEVSRDGAEAIELYIKAKESGKPFDVVILDLTNKLGMGGKEAIRELLEIDSNVKAVISSGYFNDPIMSNFDAYGFKGVLAKPYRMDELKKVLEGVIERAF